VRDAGDGERASGEGSVAGLAVACHGLHEEAQHSARRPVGELAVSAHAVAVAEEARAEDVVGAATGDGREDALEVARVVLAVAVEVDGGRVALVTRDREPGAKRRAEPARDRMRVDASAALARDVGSGVAGAVVHQKEIDIHAARAARDRGEDATDGGLLVTGNRHGEAAVSARPRGGGLHVRILDRHEGAAAGGLRRRQSEQARHGRGELKHRARLV